jgi:hypothetical protein
MENTTTKLFYPNVNGRRKYRVSDVAKKIYESTQAAT